MLYHELDHLRDEIRLLQIITVEPQIVCKLSNLTLLDDPVFDALSYTWGDANQRDEIVVNGTTISVTTNLAQAIRAVFYSWSDDGSLVECQRL